MKVFYNKNGTLDKVIGDSIFAQSNDSNVLQIKIDYPETSALQTVFLVPDGEGGVAPAEPLIMILKADYVDGGYMWEALIGAEYLDGAGKAYLSVRVLNESETVIKTTRMVQFTIEPSGSYEPTSLTTEQADQILLLIAGTQADILALQEKDKEFDAQIIYDADVSFSGIYNQVIDLVVTVPNYVDTNMLDLYGLKFKIKPATETGDLDTVITSSGLSNSFGLWLTVKNEADEIVYERNRIRIQHNHSWLINLEKVSVPSNNSMFFVKFEDGFWYSTGLVYQNATTSLNGLMSSSDKNKLTNLVVEKALDYPTATLVNTQELYIKDGGTAKKTTIQAFSNYLEPKIVQQLSSGATEKPTLTDLGTGSVTVNACCVNLYNNDDFNGLIKNYDIAPITVELTDGATNYIIADYNSGNPILRKTIDRSEINQSNVVPIFTIVRTGTILHTLDWDEMGKGAIEKNIEKSVAVRRFERESGLALSVYGTRNINLSSGAVWYGLTRVALEEILTDVDNIAFYYHNAGEWTVSVEPQFRNTQYDNGTDLVELTANRYAVIWLWRGVEYQKHLYAVLGSGDYTLNQATASDVPNPPSTVSSHAILVGRIIVQKGSDTPESVESAFDITMNLSGASVHNDLTGRDAENAHPASSINYSNTTSGLTATNSQVAIDEIVGLIGDIGEALDLINGEEV